MEKTKERELKRCKDCLFSAKKYDVVVCKTCNGYHWLNLDGTPISKTKKNAIDRKAR